MRKILTKDASGKRNGWVLPLWNALEEPGLRPDQVYVTAVAPYSSKGPHLHMRRRGLFACIQGNVRLVRRVEGKYIETMIGEDYAENPVLVEPGVPCAIYNDSNVEALVINMPSPSWSAQDPDEHAVEGWLVK